MIPLSLRFAAFGPYEKEQFIDFTLFRQDGLFLISGPTGAGKTAILDGMTYALFGRSSGGGRGSFSSMRCQYAKEEALTFVQFIFSHEGKRYEFYRHLRPTRRKDLDGFEEMARAGELREDGAMVPFAANMKKTAVDQYAEKLLGLSYDQFRQIILLPQGQFERLLTADTEEKEKILRTLFGAELWSQAAEWLGERANEMLAEARELRTRRDVLLGSAGVETFEALEARVAADHKAAQDREEELLAAQKTLEGQKNLQAEARALAARFERLEQLSDESRALGEQEAEIARLREQREAAERAEKVAPYFDAHVAAVQEAEKRAQQLAGAKAQQEHSKQKDRAAQQQYEKSADWQFSLEEIQRIAAKLEQEVGQLQAIGKEKQAFSKAKQQWGEKNNQKQARERELQNSAQQLADLRERIERLEEAAAGQAALTAKVAELEALEKARAQAQQLREKIVRIEEQGQELRARETRLCLASEKSDAAYEKAYERYLEGAAQLVAQGLAPGDTCPVCGNRFQGHLIARGAELIGREEMLAFQQQREADRAALEQCRRSLAVQAEQERAQREQLACLTAEIGQQGEAQGALERAREQAKQAQAAAERLLAARRRRSQLEQAQQDAQEAFKQAAASEQEHREALVGIKARLDAMRDSFRSELRPAALEAELCKVRAEMAELKERIGSAQRQRESAQRELAAAEALLGSALEEERKAAEKARAAERVCEEAFAAQGFLNVAQFESARLEQPAILALSARITAYEKKVQAVQGEREALLHMLEGKSWPDMAALEKDYRQAETAANTLREQLAASRQQLRSLEALKEEARKADELFKQKAPEADLLQNFAATLRGNRGVGIGRFVMGILLSAVTREANVLLESVHGGRYRLLRTREAVGGKRKAGLNFEVLDALSAETRGVASLSGGEKFLLSLSLCLGLSVFLQRRTGKVNIEAMFIDEGFGTLDSASIGEALYMLLSVKSSRRLVGIISHVTALSDNIPCAIRVQKGERGSSLKVIH